MIKTDDMYLENLKELLYDDKKVVTYKFLSVFLGVHVNLAKQMLYTFYEKEKKSGKNIYALFYVSGLVREKDVVAAEAQDGSPGDESEKHVIMLCRDNEYPEIKKSFVKLYSVHVYCLSAYPITDVSVLQPVLGDILRLGEEQKKSPIEYGPFSLSAEIRPVMGNQSVVTDKPSEVKTTVKVETDKGNLKDTDRGGKIAAKTDSKAKNFFGSQAANGSRSKSPTKSNGSKNKAIPQQSSIQSSFSKTKPVSKTKEIVKSTKEEFKTSQGRKRVRLESESGSEDEDRSSKKQHAEFTSSDDEESGTEASEERHPLRIDSDPEPEQEEKPDSPEESEPVGGKAVSREGRKRAVKTVVKTYEDEDGFVVTTKEQVVVSESDDEASVPMETNASSDATNGPSAIKPKPQEAVATKPAVAPKEQTSEAAKKKATSASVGSSAKGKGATSGNQPKSKQASIMSFFQKK